MSWNNKEEKVQCVYLFLVFIREDTSKLLWLFYATNISVMQFRICFLKIK